MIRRRSIVGPFPAVALWLAAGTAAGLLAGEPIREVQPGSARKPGTPSGGLGAPVPDRLPNLPSLGPGISPGSLPDAPAYTPYQPNKPDPETQRRMMLLMDKQRNWLLENAARLNTKPKAGAGEALNPEGASAKDSLAKISAERIRRATESPDDKAGTAKNGDKAANPLDPAAEREDGDDKRRRKDADKDDPSKPKSALAFVNGSALGSPLESDRTGESGKSSLASDFFVSPKSGADADRAHDRFLGRAADFDQILGSIGTGQASGGVDLTRALPDRTRQFESILSGAESGVGSPSAGTANPLAAAAVAAPSPRPDLSQGLGRLNMVQQPASAPPIPAPTVQKLQPRPVFLQIPTRGL